MNININIKIYKHIPSKGESFKCDCTCINDTTEIGKHVIEVNENCGKLPDFVP